MPPRPGVRNRVPGGRRVSSAAAARRDPEHFRLRGRRVRRGSLLHPAKPHLRLRRALLSPAVAGRVAAGSDLLPAPAPESKAAASPRGPPLPCCLPIRGRRARKDRRAVSPPVQAHALGFSADREDRTGALRDPRRGPLSARGAVDSRQAGLRESHHRAGLAAALSRVRRRSLNRCLRLPEAASLDLPEAACRPAPADSHAAACQEGAVPFREAAPAAVAPSAVVADHRLDRLLAAVAAAASAAAVAAVASLPHSRL